MIRVLLFFGILGRSLCHPSASLDDPAVAFQTSNSIDPKQDFLENVYTDCADKGSMPCFKYKLFAFVDKMMNKDEINLTNGITVIKTTNTGFDGAPRALNPKTADSSDIFTGLLNRAEGFLNSHTLKVDLRGSDVLNAVTRVGRTLDEISEDDDASGDDAVARKKKKGGKLLLPLLMMLKMKLLGLIPAALGLIALMAGKALILGKIALLLSLILALKKLLSHQKTVTYEIVSHPHHATSHDSYSPSADAGSYGGSSHGGWGRSADAHDMAYSAQKPTS